MFRKLVAAAIASVLAVSPVLAGEKKFEAGVNSPSKYVPNGFVVEREQVFQPRIGLRYGDLTASSWHNYSTEKGRLTETDASIGLDNLSVYDFGLSAGYTYLNIPDADFGWTEEVNATVKGDVGPVGLEVRAAHDIGNAGGDYASATIGKEFSVAEKVNMVPTYTLGWNGNYLREGSGFSYQRFTVSWQIKADEVTTITPSISFSDARNSGFEDVVFGGVDFNVEF